MTRHALEIRDAGLDDLEAIMLLWNEGGSAGSELVPRPVEDARTALAHIASAPDERMLVGLREDQVVAVMHLRRAPISPIHTEMALHTSYLLVLPRHRKQGFARALLEVAVAWAEEKDITNITAITSSSSRDTNRFLARLGLAEVATVRAAKTSSLRRRLAPDPIRPAPGHRNLGLLLAQRRSMRKIAPGATPDPARPVGPDQ